MLGFYLDYAVSTRWIVRFNSEVTDLNIGEHSGRVLQSSVAIEYRLGDLLGLGLHLGSMDLQ
jgi:hypothetical protein